MPQFFQCVMQSRLNRAKRAAKSRRNLLQRRPREETEFHDQSMLFRQGRHRSANSFRIFGDLCGAIGRPLSASFLSKSIWCGKRNGVLVSPPFQEPVP